MAEKAEYLICHRYTGFEAYLMQVDGDQYYITFSAQEALRFHDLGEARTVAERMRAKLQDDEWTAEKTGDSPSATGADTTERSDNGR